MKLIQTIKHGFNSAKTKFNKMSTADKAKVVIKGMICFGTGWAFADKFIDDKHGKVVYACTTVAAWGLGTVAGMAACEATDAVFDSWGKLSEEAAAEMKKETEES